MSKLNSTPMLTANIYTHVLVKTKADALAKLPEIVPAAPGKESAARTGTGTDDMLMSDDAKIIVMPVDSFGTDLEAQIRTYKDSGTTGKITAADAQKTKIPLCRKGKRLAERQELELACYLFIYTDLMNSIFENTQIRAYPNRKSRGLQPIAIIRVTIIMAAYWDRL